MKSLSLFSESAVGKQQFYFQKNLLIAVVLLSIFGVSSLSGQCVISSNIVFNSTENTAYVGQTFTAACSGNVSSVQFFSIGYPSQAGIDVLISVRSSCGGTVLASQVVPFPNPNPTATFWPGIPVIQGQTYAIEISGANGESVSNLEWGFGYSGGEMYLPNCQTQPGQDLGFTVIIAPCTPPTAYSVTGGGFCPPATSAAVGLSGSQLGVNYQLKKGGVNLGAPVAGTGAAFDFPGLQTPDVYTVAATREADGCTASMTGSVTVAQNPSITSITASNQTACDGNGTTCTTDDTYQMDVLVNLSEIPNGTFSLLSPDLASPVGPFFPLLSMNFIGLAFKATGAPVSLTGDLSNPNACDLTVPNAITAPASCSAQNCSILNLYTFLPTGCNNNGTMSASDDFFQVHATVEFNYAPPTGNLVIKRGNIVVASVASSTLSCVKDYTFLNVNLAADGQPLILTAEFTGGNCSFTNSSLGNAPNSCSCFLQNNFATVQPKCFGGSNGSITTTTTQANLPCTYSWVLPSGAIRTTRNLSNLKAGQYSLTTTDNAGCTLTNTVFVGQPTAVTVTATTTSNTATINAMGGTPPYLYNRLSGVWQTSNVFTGLQPNTPYNFRVRDANNCQRTLSAKTKPAGANSGQATDRFEFENRGENQFVVFPNPADNLLKINFLNDETVVGWVEIFNQLGQRVLGQNLTVEPGEEGVLQVEHLPEGSYFFNFKNENGSTVSGRFLKN